MLINSSNFRSVLRKYNFQVDKRDSFFTFNHFDSSSKIPVSEEELQKILEMYKKYEKLQLKINEMEKQSLENKINFYESQEIYTYSNINPIADMIVNNSNLDVYDKLFFLFHGVRFDNNLTKFENILKTGKIFAGNYISNYFPYSDNCNEGEYVSLIDYDPNFIGAIRAFLLDNVTFVINPKVNAIKTMYLTFDEWNKISSNTKNLKQRYSYLNGEYQVKEFISLDDVVAILIPVSLEIPVKKLLHKYDLIHMPVLLSYDYFQDNSCNNFSNQYTKRRRFP